MKNAMHAAPTERQLDTVFAALADPTRRAILARLSAGPANVGELAAPFEMSLPAVSKHLKVLEGAGLLARRRDGRIHHCTLEAGPLEDAQRWIDATRMFWRQGLDRLADYLDEQQDKKEDDDNA